jgi:Spy/CpxP family protein refolding chaperone
MIIKTFLVLTVTLLSVNVCGAGDIGARERHQNGTAHASQAIPTEAAPTSQAVPTAAPASSVPTPAPAQVRMRTIFDFEKELELNAAQVKQLKETVALLTAKLKENQTKLNDLAATLMTMIRKNADEAEMKALLDQIASLQVSGQLTDIRTTAQINTILTPQQKERWIGIQIGDRAHFTK